MQKIEITKKQSGSNKSAWKLADKELAVDKDLSIYLSKEDKDNVEKEEKEDITKKQLGSNKFAKIWAEKKAAEETGPIIDVGVII